MNRNIGCIETREVGSERISKDGMNRNIGCIETFLT